MTTRYNLHERNLCYLCEINRVKHTFAFLVCLPGISTDDNRPVGRALRCSEGILCKFGFCVAENKNKFEFQPNLHMLILDFELISCFLCPSFLCNDKIPKYTHNTFEIDLYWFGSKLFRITLSPFPSFKFTVDCTIKMTIFWIWCRRKSPHISSGWTLVHRCPEIPIISLGKINPWLFYWHTFPICEKEWKTGK